MAGDLFDRLNTLFTKTRPVPPEPDPYSEEVVPRAKPLSRFVVNRFIASQLDFAAAAKELNLKVWDDDLAWEIWRTALPKWNSAPRMYYMGPKKEAKDELVQEVCRVFAFSPQQAKEALHLVELARKTGTLRAFFGLEE